MSILVRNARLINPDTNYDGISDILIEDGKFAKVGKGIITDAETYIDAEGLWALPGLIDVHCHLRDPGLTHKEDIATGAKSAAAGGFTTICAMPNTVPALDSTETVEYVVAKAKEAAKINVLPVGAITLGMNGESLTDVAALKRSGACAISEDGKTVDDSWLMLKAMHLARENDLPVLCHCEDKSLSAGGVMNEGKLSRELGLKGISDESEEVIIARDLELQSHAGAKVHFCHVSTKGGVSLIRRAKVNGANVTAEVCPHHFSLTDEEILRHGTNAKMAPPLRDIDDVAELLVGLADGTIDIIATDHAPHSKDEKSQGIREAPFGIVGFETALPLAVTHLVNEGIISPMQLAEKMCLNPARLLGIDKGSVKAGKIADLTLIDPNCEVTVDVTKLSSKSNNCPYDGMKLKGRVVTTIAGGKIVYDSGSEK